MALLDDMKTALRISATTTAFNGEIQELIDAAKADLQLSGIVPEKVIDTDPLIKRAVTVYVKANFGWDNPDSEKLTHSYELLKMHLTLSQEYTGYVVTFNVTSSGSPLEDATITFNGQEKITDGSGKAVFNGLKAAQNMVYLVTLDGYQDARGDVDLDGSATVAVLMAVST